MPMILYLTAKTSSKDILLDSIELRTKDNETLFLEWDESDIARTDTGFNARYKGVYFNHEYSNGLGEKLRDAVISDMTWDIPDGEELESEPVIIWMEFYDSGHIYKIDPTVRSNITQEKEKAYGETKGKQTT